MEAVKEKKVKKTAVKKSVSIKQIIDQKSAAIKADQAELDGLRKKYNASEGLTRLRKEYTGNFYEVDEGRVLAIEQIYFDKKDNQFKYDFMNVSMKGEEIGSISFLKNQNFHEASFKDEMISTKEKFQFLLDKVVSFGETFSVTD